MSLCPKCRHSHAGFRCGVVVKHGRDQMGADDVMCPCHYRYDLEKPKPSHSQRDGDG